MNIKQVKELVLNKLQRVIQCRENQRGTGVLLAENIDSYYIQVGEIHCLQSLCQSLKIETDLINYNPYETDEDDNKFNYYMGLGPIGRMKNE